MLANISLISGLAPIVAPVLGSQLMLVIPWRGVFWALAAYGSALLIASLALIPETLIPGAHVRGARFAALVRMRNVFRDRVFVGVAIAGGMIFGALITYLSTSPFIFQTTLGLSPQQFGLLFGANAVGLLVATQASARLMRWIEPARLLTGALCVLVLCGLLLVLLPALGAGFWGIAATCLVFVSACGFSTPASAF